MVNNIIYFEEVLEICYELPTKMIFICDYSLEFGHLGYAHGGLYQRNPWFCSDEHTSIYNSDIELKVYEIVLLGNKRPSDRKEVIENIRKNF